MIPVIAKNGRVMRMGIMKTMSVLLDKSSKKVSQAARKIRRLQRRSRKMITDRKRVGEEEVGEEDEGLWQKSILMGEKCQPLDFSGVIYYDADGNKLSDVPPPRSPLPRPLPSNAQSITAGHGRK